MSHIREFIQSTLEEPRVLIAWEIWEPLVALVLYFASLTLSFRFFWNNVMKPRVGFGLHWSASFAIVFTFVTILMKLTKFGDKAPVGNFVVGEGCRHQQG